MSLVLCVPRAADGKQRTAALLLWEPASVQSRPDVNWLEDNVIHIIKEPKAYDAAKENRVIG